MLESQFKYDFLHEYLWCLYWDKPYLLSGVFSSCGSEFMWGALAEYGPPPPGGLIIEISSDETRKEGDAANYRFWYARDLPSGKTGRGRAVMRDELVESDG